MDNTYSISEVAEKLNIADKTLRRWEEAGKFRSSRTLGNQRRYSVEDLQILDAIKHGSLTSQADLLTREQAALVVGVSPVTIDRYVAEGLIHPFVTVANTYYPRPQLENKMQYLKPKVAAEHPKTIIKSEETKVYTPTLSKPKIDFDYRSHVFSILSTILIVTIYHFLFNQTLTPKNPTPSPAVQGVSDISPKVLNLVEDMLDSNGGITTPNLTTRLGLNTPNLSLIPGSAPTSATPGTLYYDATAKALKIYFDNSWQTLATSSELTKLKFDLESNLATKSASGSGQR